MKGFSRKEVDSVLGRTAGWAKGFALPADASETVIEFSRLSRRKKLLTLILLTDPANDRLPGLLEGYFEERAGTFAWLALNWVIRDQQRLQELLGNAHLNSVAQSAIGMAVAAGRCVDEISPILRHDNCRKPSLAIAQHGSLKQRISLVEALSAAQAEALVCGSDPDLIARCIDWARSIDS